MAKPPGKNPGDTILSSEWNQGWDWMQEGHGSTTNADMVDERHAAAGAWPGLVWADYTQLNIPAGTMGWVTVMKLAAKGQTTVTLAEKGAYSGGVVMVQIAGTYSAPVRAYRNGGFNPAKGGIVGVRVVQDDDGTRWGQVYVKTPDDDDGVIDVYLRRWMGGESGASIDTGPPSGTVTVRKVVVLQNGSWRLARALTGGGGVGWMSAEAEQAIFTQTTTAALIDGVTGTAAVSIGAPSSGWAYSVQYFTATYPIALSRVQVWMKRGSGRIGWSVAYYDETSGTWQDVVPFWYDVDGTGGVYQVNEKSFTRTVATRWRVKLGIYEGSDTGYFSEVQFYQDSSLVISGVPAGCAGVLYDGVGATLESVRRTAWDRAGFLLFTANMDDVAEVQVTRPDGSTDWLRFPTWAIDGGTLTNGDVLTLYPEA